MLHTFLIVVAVIILLGGIVMLGFVIPPRRFRGHPAPTQPGQPTPLPPDLPAPVRRHFMDTIGPAPMAIHSAVLWGRGRACFGQVWLPFRFRAWYRPGEAFLRRLEVTWFMRPVLRGMDSWIHGMGSFRMGDRDESGPRVDQAELLTLWAEMVWMPSALVKHPAAHWEAVDERTARLSVPFKDGTETLEAHFDPASGRMTHFSALRFAEDSPVKEPWRVDLLTWRPFYGMLIPGEISVAWGESGSPWSYWSLDGVAYNVNVSDQLGPARPGSV